MPLFEFSCRQCETVFEEITKFDETGVYSGVVCPQCGSGEKEKLISIPAAPVPHDTHDWQYNNKLPKAMKEREMAEKASHMGSQPYNPLDDISSGNHFGNVK